MVHSVSGWTRGVQVKVWDPLRTRATPEHLRGVFTTRRYTNTRSPLPCLTCRIGWARFADMQSRCQRRSSTFNQLTVCPSRLVTTGNDHLLLLARNYGTVFWITSHLPHHWQCFDKKTESIYLGSHIRTLPCSLIVVVLDRHDGHSSYLLGPF